MSKNDPSPALPLPGEGANQNHRLPKVGASQNRRLPRDGADQCHHLPKEGADHSLPPGKGGLRGVLNPATNNDDQASPSAKGKVDRGLFNHQKQKENRRALRNNPTEPERRLWQAVRSKQLGVKFRRQHGIGPYIVDFYCAELNLVVELDGESHYTDEGMTYDQERDTFLREHGLKLIRFTNPQIIQELDAVLDLLLKEIEG